MAKIGFRLDDVQGSDLDLYSRWPLYVTVNFAMPWSRRHPLHDGLALSNLSLLNKRLGLVTVEGDLVIALGCKKMFEHK